LAVCTTNPVPALPDVPPLSQTVPGYEAGVWHGIGAPAKVAPEIVSTLHDAVNAVLADPKVMARLDQLGAVPAPMTVDAFAKSIADDTAKWAKVIKFAGIQPE
jgi:tripartite-type tricarboxylate transporter receptor subunit TctC